MSYEFTECLACEKLPGQAALCEPCLANRTTINNLTTELENASDKNDINLIVLAESLEERDTAQCLLADITKDRDRATASLQNLTATIAQQSEYIISLEGQRAEMRNDFEAGWYKRIVRVFSRHAFRSPQPSSALLPGHVDAINKGIGEWKDAH